MGVEQVPLMGPFQHSLCAAATHLCLKREDPPACHHQAAHYGCWRSSTAVRLQYGLAPRAVAGVRIYPFSAIVYRTDAPGTSTAEQLGSDA